MRIEWLWQSPGPIWQWVGLAATLVGVVFSLAAFVAAWLARGQAKRAVEATRRLARAFDAADMIAELERLDAALSRADFHAVVTQANRLRGEIVRFLNEAADIGILSLTERNALLVARSHSATITSVATNTRMKRETKMAQIGVALGELSENLNAVVGRRRADATSLAEAE